MRALKITIKVPSNQIGAMKFCIFGSFGRKQKIQHIFPINKQECGLFLFDSLLRKENENYSNENKRIERVVNINFLFIIGYLYIQMLEMKQHSQSQRDSIVILT